MADAVQTETGPSPVLRTDAAIQPLICAGVFEVEILAVGSPLGLFIYVLEEETLTTSWLIGLLAYHLAICAVPTIKVWQQWGRIREVRELVDKEQAVASVSRR